MTNHAVTENSDAPTGSSAAAKPARKGRGLLIFVLVVAFLILAMPVLLVAAGVSYLYLRPAAPAPPAQLIALPDALEAKKGDAAGEVSAIQRENKHPLDPALEIAYQDLEHIRKNIRDYTATLVSHERIGGKLNPEQTMFVKIRNGKLAGDEPAVPFSVYIKFLAPKDRAGREVIYVAGQNDNMLIGHEAGLLNFTRYKLYTNGIVAMNGERYPITEIGMERLAEQLIKRGEEERLLDPVETHVEVTVEKGFERLERKCTRIRLHYPDKTAKVEFHSAEICIDEELLMPTYYVAYSWPTEPGGEPVLEEEYTYTDIKLNVGLTDADFDPDNKEYKFPKTIFDASK